MPKYRPHDVAQARAEEEADRAAAAAAHSDDPDRQVVMAQLAQLRRVVELGLMDCYSGLEDLLGDWLTGFAWDPARRASQVELLQADPVYPALREALLTEYGVDLDEELDDDDR
jgi:hypothetical protein